LRFAGWATSASSDGANGVDADGCRVKNVRPSASSARGCEAGHLLVDVPPEGPIADPS
jgi:hypothetical protein